METPAIHTIPFLGGKTSVKDDIFSILSEEPNLSAKEIHVRVKRKQGKDVTYQAVHKVLQQLDDQKVVSKIGSKYAINPEWVGQTKDYLTLLEHTHGNKHDPKKILQQIEKGPATITFSSLTDMGVFTAALLVEYREKIGKPMPNYALIRHGWWPFRFEFSQYELLRKMDDGNPNNRVVIAKDTPFDQWIGRNYQLLWEEHPRLKCGVKGLELEEDLIARGDMIIQTRFSTETKKFMDKWYNEIHGLSDLFKIYFVKNIRESNLHITMTISKNPAMAELVREKIKSYFGEK